MTTYTGTADANGDFTIPFLSPYTSGEKIIVTAEKDNAIKTIELHAPASASEQVPAIRISGSWQDFPNNIGAVIMDLPGAIGGSVFQYTSLNAGFAKATSLQLLNCTSIGSYAFSTWTTTTALILPNTLTQIGANAFNSWSALLEINIPNSVITIANGAFASAIYVKKLTLGAGITSIGAAAFSRLSSCNEIVCLAISPPTITSTTFDYLKSTCVFKVPAASVTAYQAAPNWSVFASRIQAI